MYEAFVQRLRQSQNLDDVQVPESRIISNASVPLHARRAQAHADPGRVAAAGAAPGRAGGADRREAGTADAGARQWQPRAPPSCRRITRPAPAQPAKQIIRSRCGAGRPSWARSTISAQLRAADFVLDYPASKYSHAMAGLVRQLEAKDSGERRRHRRPHLGRFRRKPQRHRRQPGARGNEAWARRRSSWIARPSVWSSKAINAPDQDRACMTC